MTRKGYPVDFTQFYLVLPSFTQFYLFLPSFDLRQREMYGGPFDFCFLGGGGVFLGLFWVCRCTVTFFWVYLS